MKTIGRVAKICDKINGESSNGQPWEKQTVVIATLEERPRTLAFDFFGLDKVAQLEGLKEQTLVEIGFDIDCREVVGKDGETRYFTSLRGYSLKPYELKTPEQVKDGKKGGKK